MINYITSVAYQVAYSMEKRAFKQANPNWKQTKKEILRRASKVQRNIAAEIIATRDYAEAKTRGVILVSQAW